MKRFKITTGGQVSLPAEIRHRWATSTVLIEDRGDELVMRPAPDDPIGAVRGRFAHRGLSADELREQSRQEEAEAEERHLR